jgi:hypothetical protein
MGASWLLDKPVVERSGTTRNLPKKKPHSARDASKTVYPDDRIPGTLSLASRWDAGHFGLYPAVSLRSTAGKWLSCLRHERGLRAQVGQWAVHRTSTVQHGPFYSS